MKPTRNTARIVNAIATRAVNLYKSLDIEVSGNRVFDTVVCVHCGTIPLKLEELLAADDSNFIHDIGGLLRHFDPNRGQVVDCFLPRYAA